VVVFGPSGPVTMLMTSAGLIPMPMLTQVPGMTSPGGGGMGGGGAVVVVGGGVPSTNPAATVTTIGPRLLSSSPPASRGSRGLLAAPGSMNEGSTTTNSGSDLPPTLQPGQDGEDIDADEAANSKPRQPRAKSPSAEMTALREAAESRKAVDKLESALGITPTSNTNNTDGAGVGGASSSTTIGDAAAKRKPVAPIHTVQDAPPKKLDDSALRVAELQARGGKPAPESGLGSFMYVKNSRYDPTRSTPDNPKYWVGRVAEIMRGGRIRLHWHREVTLGSGSYVPTNN
jgi:hypothetical protein